MFPSLNLRRIVVSQVRKSKQNLIASFKTKTVTPFAVAVVAAAVVVVVTATNTLLEMIITYKILIVLACMKKMQHSITEWFINAL